jgi:nicotinate-nucleotide pyrophosphorylase
MPRFQIELAHEAAAVACARAVEVVLKSGSHFITHADWGCKDGEHKAWIVVEVDSKDEARAVVPPVFRSQAKVVQLNAFSIEEIDEILRQHKS